MSMTSDVLREQEVPRTPYGTQMALIVLFSLIVSGLAVWSAKMIGDFMVEAHLSVVNCNNPLYLTGPEMNDCVLEGSQLFNDTAFERGASWLVSEPVNY